MKVRLWLKACGGPAVLGLLGYVIFALVDYIHPGTYAGQYRVEVIFVSLVTFYLAIAWALRNLWAVLRAYWGAGEDCAHCGFPANQRRKALDFECWGCGRN